jgi:predicted amidophosphoribosyltransferase
MHAFAVKDGVKLPSNILVIDDIYTTGNTMDMAAYVLKKAGAENVFFMTISIGQGY